MCARKSRRMWLCYIYSPLGMDDCVYGSLGFLSLLSSTTTVYLVLDDDQVEPSCPGVNWNSDPIHTVLSSRFRCRTRIEGLWFGYRMLPAKVCVERDSFFLIERDSFWTDKKGGSSWRRREQLGEQCLQRPEQRRLLSLGHLLVVWNLRCRVGCTPDGNSVRKQTGQIYCGKNNVCRLLRQIYSKKKKLHTKSRTPQIYLLDFHFQMS